MGERAHEHKRTGETDTPSNHTVERASIAIFKNNIEAIVVLFIQHLKHP